AFEIWIDPVLCTVYQTCDTPRTREDQRCGTPIGRRASTGVSVVTVHSLGLRTVAAVCCSGGARAVKIHFTATSEGQIVMTEDNQYEVLSRHVERPDFRISELRIGPTQEVPWHFHTDVRDSFLVLEGNIRITMQKPDEEVLLGQSDIFQVQPGRPHRVT